MIIDAPAGTTPYVKRHAWFASVLLTGCVLDASDAAVDEDTDGPPAETTGGGEEGTPQDPEPPTDDEEPRGEFYEGGAYWRVELVGNDAEASVQRVSSVELPAGMHEPVPILDGPFLLVGRAGEEVVGARAVRFPAGEAIELEFTDGDVAEVELDFAEAPQTVFFPKDAGAQVLELVRGTDGLVLDEVGPEELQAAEVVLRNASLLTSAYPHITVFEPGEEGLLPQEFQSGYVDRIVSVDAQVANVVLAALQDLPPR